MTAERKQRTRAPWRDDFDGTMDRLGDVLGGSCRYNPDDREIVRRDTQRMVWDVLAERIPNRQAAYWWAQGRIAAQGGAE